MNNLKDKTKTFCVLPWIHSYVNSNGAYQVCCTADEYHKGIPDNNGVIFNINNRPNVNEIMNSDFMKSLRAKMLEGEWSATCTRCLETEKLEGVSRRLLENLEHSDSIDNLIQKTKEDGEIQVKLKTLDYRLGNLCNLQCRMCSPFSSENWIKDWNDVMPPQDHLSLEQVSYYKNFDWIKKDFLLEEFKEKIIGVERIHFAGGEPLLSPQMSKILKECIHLGLAKNISISYNTNATVLPKEVLNLWKEFKEIKLLCSIDGFDEVNSYIRFPSKWSIIDTNLKYLDNHADELNITEILLSCTVQIYNVLSLRDLYEYASDFKKIIPAINLINLNFPDYMSSKVLPVDAKLEAEIRLLQIAKKLEVKIPESHLYLIDNIYQIINFMNQEDLTSELSKFKKINSQIDKKKKFKLSESIPELNKYLINYYLNEFTDTN